MKSLPKVASAVHISMAVLSLSGHFPSLLPCSSYWLLLRRKKKRERESDKFHRGDR